MSHISLRPVATLPLTHNQYVTSLRPISYQSDTIQSSTNLLAVTHQSATDIPPTATSNNTPINLQSIANQSVNCRTPTCNRSPTNPEPVTRPPKSHNQSITDLQPSLDIVQVVVVLHGALKQIDLGILKLFGYLTPEDDLYILKCDTARKFRFTADSEQQTPAD
eukprot:259312_1